MVGFDVTVLTSYPVTVRDIIQLSGHSLLGLILPAYRQLNNVIMVKLRYKAYQTNTLRGGTFIFFPKGLLTDDAEDDSVNEKKVR